MKNYRKIVAKFLVCIMILATQANSPMLVRAAAELVLAWSNINVAGFDVSQNIYLNHILDIEGDLYVGVTGSMGGDKVFLVTSTNMIDWEIRSPNFRGFEYFNGFFYGLRFHDGIVSLYRTDLGLEWQTVDLPEGYQAREIWETNGFLRLDYVSSRGRGIMLSKDGTTWHDLGARMFSNEPHALPTFVASDGTLLTYVNEVETTSDEWDSGVVVGRNFYRLDWQNSRAVWEEIPSLRLDLTSINITSERDVVGFGHTRVIGDTVATSLYMKPQPGHPAHDAGGIWDGDAWDSFALSSDMSSWRVVHDASAMPLIQELRHDYLREYVHRHINEAGVSESRNWRTGFYRELSTGNIFTTVPEFGLSGDNFVDGTAFIPVLHGPRGPVVQLRFYELDRQNITGEMREIESLRVDLDAINAASGREVVSLNGAGFLLDASGNIAAVSASLYMMPETVDNNLWVRWQGGAAISFDMSSWYVFDFIGHYDFIRAHGLSHAGIGSFRGTHVNIPGRTGPTFTRILQNGEVVSYVPDPGGRAVVPLWQQGIHFGHSPPTAVAPAATPTPVPTIPIATPAPTIPTPVIPTPTIPIPAVDPSFVAASYTATTNANVNLRSSPTSRPDGVTVSNDNVIASIGTGVQLVVIDRRITRAWTDSPTGAWHDGLSGWVNVRTVGGMSGYIYIVFLDF